MTLSTATPVIYDGDMGGDDLIAIMMLLGNPHRFDLKGITTVFGNVDMPRATKNVQDLMSHFNIYDIPVAMGAAKPLRGPTPFGDDAYGADGLGGVKLMGDNRKPIDMPAADFIIQTVMQSPTPVTIFGTGPFTNIANALTMRPEIKDNIQQIILMGGGLAPGPRPNVKGRAGNITIHSEFNLFQDPFAANVVFESGVNHTLMTMDATQCIHLDQSMRSRVSHIYSRNVGNIVKQLLAPAEALDVPKFGTTGPFIHDPHVVTFALQKHMYTGSMGNLHAEEHEQEPGVNMNDMRRGKLTAEWRDNANTAVIRRIVKPEMVKQTMLDSLANFAKLAI